jgi:hypothetical protein
MPVFRIHRIRDHAFQQFRWAAHTAGAAAVKAKDYEPGGEVEAESAYAAWTALRGAGTPLRVGDVLEAPGGDLRIFKYIGFEEAHWFVPEPRPEAAPDSGPARTGPASPDQPAPQSV